MCSEPWALCHLANCSRESAAWQWWLIAKSGAGQKVCKQFAPARLPCPPHHPPQREMGEPSTSGNSWGTHKLENTRRVKFNERTTKSHRFRTLSKISLYVCTAPHIHGMQWTGQRWLNSMRVNDRCDFETDTRQLWSSAKFEDIYRQRETLWRRRGFDRADNWIPFKKMRQPRDCGWLFDMVDSAFFSKQPVLLIKWFAQIQTWCYIYLTNAERLCASSSFFITSAKLIICAQGKAESMAPRKPFGVSLES